MVHRLFMHTVVVMVSEYEGIYSIKPDPLSPSRKVRESLKADVISIHSSQLATPVLLLSQNGTVRSD